MHSDSSSNLGSPGARTSSVGSPRLTNSSAGRQSIVTPSVGSSRVGSPPVNNHHLEPISTVRMESPGLSKERTTTTPRDVSPSAMRPDGLEAGRSSIESDIREAVGLGIQESEASSTGDLQFGTTS